MGALFLGVADDDQRVAIKLLHAQLAHDPEFRARFARELDAARKVTGPYTVRVLDASPDANPPWLATSYIPSPTLHAYVREHGR